jgi:hypothetical protein
VKAGTTSNGRLAVQKSDSDGTGGKFLRVEGKKIIINED